MATKKKIAKAVKKATGTKAAKPMLGGSIVQKAKAAVGIKSALGGGKVARGGFGRRKRKSAMWYAKEIARIKLKRRYDKVRMRI